MYREGTEHPWFYQQGFNMMIDFCVWVLEEDGLQISPFDVHPDGTGILRRAGLQNVAWKSWLAQIVDLQRKQTQILQQTAGTNKGRVAAPHFIYEAHNPPAAWSGTASVKECLDTMWEQYKLLSRQRREWEKPVTKQWQESGANQRLWTDLQSYKARLPSLTLYLIEYAKPVEYLLPPTSSILTVDGNHFDYGNFYHRVLHAAEQLSLT